MEFSTKRIEAKMRGFSSDDNLYEVENTMRELQRQKGRGLAEFLEDADNKLNDEVKRSASKNDFYFHSYRTAVIWSVFGKISFERRYYQYKKAKERDVKGFAFLDQKMGFSAGQVTPSLAELLALEGVSTPFEEAAKKVEKFLLFRMSDNTVRKETEAFGEIKMKSKKNSSDKVKTQIGYKNVKENKILRLVDGFMVLWMAFLLLCWKVGKNSRL